MRRFIFAERNGIYIIDLNKTLKQLNRAKALVAEIVGQGKKVLFVCTKRRRVVIDADQDKRAGLHGVQDTLCTIGILVQP